MKTFKYSSRNFHDGFWKSFFYCDGQGFNKGTLVYYGRNDWNTEEQAIAAQEEWENLRNVEKLLR